MQIVKARRRTVEYALIAVLAMLIGVGRTGSGQQAMAAQQNATAVTHIEANSIPYHLIWDGTGGTLSREAFGLLTEQNMPLTLIHTEPGPRGYSKYLAWFLARNGNSFDIAWCYLNDEGKEFYCWLYDYPSNQLTSLRFTGKYTFVSPQEPIGPTAIPDFTALATPTYSGPDFTYLDWTRRTGTLQSLALHPVQTSTALATQASAAPSPPATRTLSGLHIYPLQEIHVAGGNGWRNEGWRELHCLAVDASGAPYYLILYSNTPKGYVIDLKNAQIYTADYGQPVKFAEGSSVFGRMEDRVTGPPAQSIRRYAQQQIELTATQTYANPYTSVLLEADLVSPDGHRETIPGFWDGGTTWRLRLAPNVVGHWTWHTRSNDAGLNNQRGAFVCVADDQSNPGFLTVSTINPRRFVFSDASPFLPVLIDYPDLVSIAEQTGSSAGTGNGAGASDSSDSLNADFRGDIDSLAALGFDRIVGSYLINSRRYAQKSERNEGGAPFAGYDADHINPTFFQALDRRIAYCNARGIVPDLGIGMMDSELFSAFSDVQMRRLWRYVLARYSVYNVHWNLFGRTIGGQKPEGADQMLSDLTALTHRYDLTGHPITTEMPGSAADQTPAPAPLSMPQTVSNDVYVISPAGLPLWPDPSAILASRASQRRIEQATTPADTVSPFSVITLNGGALDAILSDAQYKKPVVIYDRSTPQSIDTPRYRLWEAQMQGGYLTDAAGIWIGTKRPTVQWTAFCGQLFRSTRYWRLAPHPDLLKPQPAPTDDTPAVASGSVYLLADPAWEYLVYFEHGGTVTLDLLEATGNVNEVWFNPRTGESTPVATIRGGAMRTFNAPDSGDWVLHLTRR